MRDNSSPRHGVDYADGFSSRKGHVVWQRKSKGFFVFVFHLGQHDYLGIMVYISQSYLGETKELFDEQELRRHDRAFVFDQEKNEIFHCFVG